MRWIKKDKSKAVKFKHKYGDKKIKKHFCLLPKTYYDSLDRKTIYYWLETIYLVYEWVKGEPFSSYYVFSFSDEPDHWERIGLATSYSNAVREFWG